MHAFDVATGKFAPASFNDSGLGDARFSPLTHPATGKPIPTLYAASTVNAAIAEVVLHNVPTPSTGYLHDLERDYGNHLFLSRVRTPALSLVNLTATGLKAAGLTVGSLFGGDESDYARTQAWSQWIWENMPNVQGLHWMSKRDNRAEVIVLFGDRIPSGIMDDGDSRPLQAYEQEIIDLLDEMGAGVALK
ncbi:RES family NAD+ phosphorylase [Variovorax sp. J22P168]|uniref:RES family NAD+ phosphorylase n=1 Tax=Variovorax jilinensis TaxID=3053513 RepID=UPI00257691CF|nr:RES family NAD+ phosphorylase [Variovorax sp. J22P168]MDM0015849.1 RES family NAD+ phosphorylase [Variovorax sp. J22P168]